MCWFSYIREMTVDILSISYEIALRKMPEDLTDDD